MRRLPASFGLLLAAALAPACGGGGGGGGGTPPTPVVLLAPTGFTSYSSMESITLHWNPVVNATGYVLYSATQPGITPANYLSLAGGQRTVVGPHHRFTPIVGATTYYFILAATAGASEGPPSIEISDAQSFPTVTPVPSQGTIRTLSGTLRDLVYDPVHQRVYATNETNSSLEILDPSTGVLATPLALGAQPWGLDLTADCTRLLVCLRSSSEIAVVDVTVTPPVLLGKVTVTADATGASNPRNIGIAANGRAFFTCVDAGAGYAILRQMIIATQVISQRTDVNGGQLKDPTYIGVSQDRSRIVFGQSGSGGDYQVYTSASDAFATGKVPVAIVSAAANADGSRFTLGPYLVDSTLRTHGLVSQFASTSMAFSPTMNRGYLGAGGGVIDLDRLQQIDSIVTPGTGIGSVKVDPSGLRLFATCSTGILQVPLDVNRPPKMLPGSNSLQTSVGTSIAWTLEAGDVDGDPIEFNVQNLPLNATYDPATKRITFTPSLAQAGTIIPSATIYVTDGRNATTASFGFNALNPPNHPFRLFPYNTGLVLGVTDLVHDPVRDRVYLAYTTANTLERIQAATGARLAPIVCLSAPQSVDLNAAATRMVVCPANAEYVQVFDLTVEPPVLVANVPVPDGPTLDHRRPDRVAVAANGHALVSTFDFASGACRLLDLDLASNTLAIRGDVPGVTVPTRAFLRASRDRSRIVVVAGGAAQSGFTYASVSNTFGSIVALPSQASDLDVNTDGTRIITCGGPRVYDGSLTSLGLVSGSGLRAAVRQGTTTGYRAFVSSTIEIIDLASFTSTGSFTLANGLFGPMITNAAGTQLFLTPQNSFAIVTLP